MIAVPPAGRMRGRPFGQRERGSGSVLALAIVVGMIAVLLVAVPLYSVFAARSKLAAAADAAALAAADTRSGFTASADGSQPCAIAGEIAAAGGVALAACEIDGLVVTVSVQATILGLSLSQSATAGPPPAESENGRIR